MKEKTIEIIQELGGNIKYQFADNGKVEPVVEFPSDEEDCNEPPMTFNPSAEPSFEPVLQQICKTVNSIKDSASDIIFLLYYTFHRKHNLMFFFSLVDRGVSFEQAFDIIQSVYFISYIADGKSASGAMLDTMLLIAEKLASDVSGVLLSYSPKYNNSFWQKEYDQANTDLSDIGITEEEF